MAEEYYQESLAIRRDLGDRWGIAASLNNLGQLARQQGDLRKARSLLQESLAIRRELADRRNLAVTLNVLGKIASESGEFSQALALLRESLEICGTLGDRRSLAYSLEAFATLAGLQGLDKEARRFSQTAQAIRNRAGIVPPPLDLLGALPPEEGNEGHGAIASPTLEQVFAWIEETFGAPR